MTGIGNGIQYLFMILLFVFPLGIWKLVELIGWVWQNLHWGAR